MSNPTIKIMIAAVLAVTAALPLRAWHSVSIEPLEGEPYTVAISDDLRLKADADRLTVNSADCDVDFPIENLRGISFNSLPTAGESKLSTARFTLTPGGLILTDPADCDIFDTSGRPVLSVSQATEVSFKDLEAGVYILSAPQAGLTLKISVR